MFLLDTDHVGVLQGRLTQERDRLLARMQGYSPDDFGVSIVTFHEQVNGWQSYLNRRRDAAHIVRAYSEFRRILDACASMQLVAFDHGMAEEFNALRRAGVRIGTMDLRIAATALVNDYTVLTRNSVDFEVPGLKVEDWTVAIPDRPR